MLWMSGTIIHKIGVVGVLYLTLICYALRLFVYSMLTNPWFILFVEPTNGVTAGLIYAVATSHATDIAPPGMSATVQGLVGGLQFGIGE